MSYWKDSLLIGVSQIDDQHRKLIEAIDQLMESCRQGKGRAAVGSTLQFTIAYVKVHFRDEERLQTKYAYPDMVAHKKLHARFIEDISGLQREFEETGPSITLTGKLNKTLVDWLIKHISTEDKKIGKHILDKSGNK